MLEKLLLKDKNQNFQQFQLSLVVHEKSPGKKSQQFQQAAQFQSASWSLADFEAIEEKEDIPLFGGLNIDEIVGEKFINWQGKF